MANRGVKMPFALLLMCVLGFNAAAQKIIVKGKITDAVTGEPVTYATIALRGTSIGTNSNFDGVFQLTLLKKPDSLTISCMGYRSHSVAITKAALQIFNVQLVPAFNALAEIRITPKGYINPAWAILKQVMLHKDKNNPAQLAAYQYENYSRIELDADHLGPKLLQKSFVKKALSLADSLNITGTNQAPVLPLFLSETISDYFYRSNPEARREIIKRTKTNGIGFEDGTLLAQLTGSTFQQYNFYQNFVSAAGKDFASPLSDSWKAWYDYELDKRDVLIEGKHCYQISFVPKRPQDLAFTGTIWIAKDNYALYQIKATVEPTANLNFIHQISIQQQMDGSSATMPWLPIRTRILVEVAQMSSNSSGLLAKLYTAHKNVVLNQVYDNNFFKDNISVADDAQTKDERFWDQNRPDSLTASEKSVYGLIDTIKNIPTVKNYLTLADMLINGYYRAGKLSIGPFLNSYSFNNVEGNRIRLGFKTNSDFDKKWIFSGYLAYGTKDRAIKYNAAADYILSRKNWTEAGISYTHDLNQVALLSDNYLYLRNNLFTAFTRFGPVKQRRVFDQNLLDVYIKRDLFKGFTEKVTYNNWSLNPQFPFQFYDAQSGSLRSNLQVSELQFESRWAPGEYPLLSESINRPVNLKTDATAPTLMFRYTLGLKNVFGGDFGYHKFTFNISQTLKMGALGRGRYSFSLGYIPSTLPYPLLENHLGNQTLIYNPNAFNLMRFFEFTSDKYASLNYTQHFEGLLFNSLPVIKTFNWRLVGTANILYGSLSQANREDISNSSTSGVRALGSKPYVEAGYGVENISKFLRIDFIHRLTYRDNRNSNRGGPRNFGIKISAQIRL